MSLDWVLPILRESAEYEKGLARLQGGRLSSLPESGAGQAGKPAPHPADGAPEPRSVWIEGLAGNSKWLVVAGLARDLDATLVVVTNLAVIVVIHLSARWVFA